MQLVNEFTVPADPDHAFAILSDLERMAQCLPGAVLEERNGEEFRGRLGVKIGPVGLVMASTGTVLERDAQERRFVLRGSARERSGQGAVQGLITVTVGETGRRAGSAPTEQALVRVVTDLSLSGRVAQFGGPAITQVNRRIVGQFVKRLDGMIRDEQQPIHTGPPVIAVEGHTSGAALGGPHRDGVSARIGYRRELGAVSAAVAAGLLLGLAINRAIRLAAGQGQHGL